MRRFVACLQTQWRNVDSTQRCAYGGAGPRICRGLQSVDALRSNLAAAQLSKHLKPNWWSENKEEAGAFLRGLWSMGLQDDEQTFKALGPRTVGCKRSSPRAVGKFGHVGVRVTLGLRLRSGRTAVPIAEHLTALRPNGGAGQGEHSRTLFGRPGFLHHLGKHPVRRAQG